MDRMPTLAELEAEQEDFDARYPRGCFPDDEDAGWDDETDETEE